MTPSESCLVDTKPRSVAPSIRMPPELWIKILQSLDYAELKKAARISKTFQAYTLVSSYSLRLWLARGTCAQTPFSDVACCRAKLSTLCSFAE